MLRLVGIAAFIVVSVSACAYNPNIDKELSRTSSPDGVVDAVLVTLKSHATVATPLELHIVVKGGQPSRLTLVLRGDHFDNVSLKWKEARLLEVHYDTLRIFTFKNFWLSREVSYFSYVVEIRLKPERDSFSLGG